MNKAIVMILPSYGFDPTEAAIPWLLLTQAGHQVKFATPDGKAAAADRLMLSGVELDFWGKVPLLRRLKLVGLVLRANGDARRAYQQMIQDESFRQPMSYSQLDVALFDGVVFPGGHDKAIKPYLESEVLRAFVRKLFPVAGGEPVIPVAAICHGVLVLARTNDAQGVSVVHGRKLTSLPWSFESKAWQLGKIVRFWDPHYYRTYLESGQEPAGFWGVQQELTRLVGGFSDVDSAANDYWRKTSGMHRDNETDTRAAWVVQDGLLVTARWPGDAHGFAQRFIQMVSQYQTTQKVAA